MASSPTYPQVVRVAAIEIRAVTEDQYRAIVDAYTTATGTHPVVISDRSVSFKSGDKEVRVFLAPDLARENLAIVYWQVPGISQAAIDSTYTQWKASYGYEAVTPPQKDGTLVGTTLDSATRSGILKQVQDLDATTHLESQFGIVINPPYPRFHDYEGSGPRFTDTGHSTSLVSGLGLLLALATGVGAFGWLKFTKLRQRLVRKRLWPV